MANQQLPRTWFRLGSMTRPTTTTTPLAPVSDQPRPVPALIRPPILRPAPMPEPTESTSPKQSVKSPPQFPRPASLTTPVKKPASPPAPAVQRPVLPSPSNAPRLVTPVASPIAKQSESFGKDNSKQSTPVPSPLVPKSIPAVPSPYQSPKPKATTTPQSPLPSPKTKSISSSPPSPLILPPSQLSSVAESKHETIPQEVERKTVVFQKVMDKPSQPEHHFTNYHNPGFVQNGKKQEQHRHEEDQGKDKGIRTKKTIFGSSDDKDTDTRVITMAGENKGAFMEVFLSDKNNSRHHLIRQNNSETQNEDETSNKVNDNNQSKKKSMTRNKLPMKAFLNSNVQAVNNSIMMDSNFTHHDPGIHLVYSRMSPPSADEEDEGQQ